MIDNRYIERTMGSTQIRQASMDDIDTIVALYVARIEEERNITLGIDAVERIRLWVANTLENGPDVVLAITRNNVVIGEIFADLTVGLPEDGDKVLFVYGLYIDSSSRQSGTPLCLFRALVSIARENNAKIQFMESLTSKNKIQFFERSGCKPIGVLYQGE